MNWLFLVGLHCRDNSEGDVEVFEWAEHNHLIEVRTLLIALHVKEMFLTKKANSENYKTNKISRNHCSMYMYMHLKHLL